MSSYCLNTVIRLLLRSRFEPATGIFGRVIVLGDGGCPPRATLPGVIFSDHCGLPTQEGVQLDLVSPLCSSASLWWAWFGYLTRSMRGSDDCGLHRTLLPVGRRLAQNLVSARVEFKADSASAAVSRASGVAVQWAHLLSVSDVWTNSRKMPSKRLNRSIQSGSSLKSLEMIKACGHCALMTSSCGRLTRSLCVDGRRLRPS